MDAAVIYPYYQVPDESDPAALAAAFLDCFHTPAGHIVLNRCYWAHVMANAPEGEAGQRHQGKIEWFREVIDMMQQGEAARRQSHG